MSRIPNNIHMVYGLAKDFGWQPYQNDDNIPRPGADPFNLIRYLAVKSAYEVNKPDNFYFYYQYEPTGELWEKAKQYITPVEIEAPNEIFGNPVDRYAHKADIIRLQALIEEGGIYLDSDVLCVKPFTPFLNLEGSQGGCVIGQEGLYWENDGKLTNAILMAEPNSEFCKIWLESFKSFNDDHWGGHGVKMPFILSRKYPHLITIEHYKKFTWPLYHTPVMKWFYRGEGWDTSDNVICETGGTLKANEDLSESYCIHLWMNRCVSNEFYKDWPNNPTEDWMTVDRIKTVDTPFNILARPFVQDL